MTDAHMMGGPEMAPQTPQGSGRPGEPVAPRDPPQSSGRPGEPVAPRDPLQSSGRPGEPGPPLDLAAWLARQRWFAGKTRRIVATTVDDRLPVGGATLCVLRVGLDDGSADRYVVTLGRGADVVDALDDPEFCRALLDVVARAGEIRGQRGRLTGRRGRAFVPTLGTAASVRRIAGEQSNTSVVFGEALIMKVFRRLADGLNPDLEITRFLTEHTSFDGTPRLAGALEYLARDGGVATLAVLQEFVADGRDGWRFVLERLDAGDHALVALTRLSKSAAAQLLEKTAAPLNSLRTITTLNTGLGDDNITVNLNSADGFFVLNTQGQDNTRPLASDKDVVHAEGSTLPLVIFGGQDADEIDGGTGGPGSLDTVDLSAFAAQDVTLSALGSDHGCGGSLARLDIGLLGGGTLRIELLLLPTQVGLFLLASIVEFAERCLRSVKPGAIGRWPSDR